MESPDVRGLRRTFSVNQIKWPLVRHEMLHCSDARTVHGRRSSRVAGRFDEIPPAFFELRASPRLPGPRAARDKLRFPFSEHHHEKNRGWPTPGGDMSAFPRFSRIDGRNPDGPETRSRTTTPRLSPHSGSRGCVESALSLGPVTAHRIVFEAGRQKKSRFQPDREATPPDTFGLCRGRQFRSLSARARRAPSPVSMVILTVNSCRWV